ncbi:1,4-alpha-glucan branching protein GlgB [Tuanshanicoccus lijuaniae]|uniref:1,4-alpha-glucan branching protein GlgB n=1 Tax=Aerococcaceae bacterium zg-1292 TaxID=2774330 RepID=UPI001935D804|nr:1,4-alpha-glucan branching protein GlgB [Aerococcaceae bacterium zg-1292]MBF6624978.1 1,4-alpha-glucan branching protein GlgB [Aerococcaceae bacterium zg-BR9]MBF6978095.1 1,4-alpha-glucan branching protein GlgB [Aerococcaceae bacterium zg-BR22]MBS4456901.1 1,4-alpha-glucan branching protein GlgB [Aerococcaceae bacterium zg-A91]MBS4458776.1 1,4-alpha-glucan branching protein GlgB [Aerococcaceae bacterium zg-BR33]
MQTSIGLPHFNEDVYFFNIGKHREAYRFLGSKKAQVGDTTGYQFSVWAPNASNVFLTGDFNYWSRTQMNWQEGGVWTVFVAEAQEGQCYKYGIDHGNGYIEYKMDPFGHRFEVAPKDASIVADIPEYEWNDAKWLRKREKRDKFSTPLSIYEVHASSWRQHPDGRYYTLTELADSLIPYVQSMGYTHIELMPLMDHPLEASWGYQITGYYGITGRYGTMAELQYLVDLAHQHDIGVILDWVPGHFCRNAYALAYFDGTPTFEYQDVNRANNIGWGTLNFDLGKTQVQSFLISNALFWLKEFHVDGLRVDAVTNMLYLDFDEGPWTPNEYGGNENLQGIDFLQKLNTTIHEELPDVYMIAEESSNREGITRPVSEGGLGFDYKWNLGWMNDTLRFFALEPYLRPQNLTLITFVFMYQYNERFILPYSHDEVVHGKHSLLGRIPGSRYDQFATLRLMQAYMAAQPGKTLNFMGNELGQYLEWRHYSELEWIDLTREYNQEYQHFVSHLNHFVKDTKAMHEWDYEREGLRVLEADAYDDGYLTMIRQGSVPRDFVIVACNFENKWQHNIPVGAPYKGQYKIVLNTDDAQYGGSNILQTLEYKTSEQEQDGEPFMLTLDLPPLSVLYLQPKRIYGAKAK